MEKVRLYSVGDQASQVMHLLTKDQYRDYLQSLLNNGDPDSLPDCPTIYGNYEMVWENGEGQRIIPDLEIDLEKHQGYDEDDLKKALKKLQEEN